MPPTSSSCSANTSCSGCCDECDHTTVPAGASTSCAVARSWPPARRIVPISATSTSASAASFRRSGACGSNRAAAALDRTSRLRVPVSDVVMASGRLKARKSVSASGRSTRNGSAISRVIGRAPGADISLESRAAITRGSPPPSPPPTRSGRRAASAAPGGSPGRARPPPRRPSSAGGCPCSTACSTSTIVAPAKASCPDSISKSSAASANRSARPSSGFAAHLLGGHVVGRAGNRSGLRQLRRGVARQPVAHRPGQPEVEQLDAVRGQEQVRRLEVAVHEPARSAGPRARRGSAARCGDASAPLSGPRPSRAASDSPASSSIAM